MSQGMFKKTSKVSKLFSLIQYDLLCSYQPKDFLEENWKMKPETRALRIWNDF